MECRYQAMIVRHDVYVCWNIDFATISTIIQQMKKIPYCQNNSKIE